MADFDDHEPSSSAIPFTPSWFPNLIDTQVDLIASTFTSIFFGLNPNPNPNPKPHPEPERERAFVGPSALARRMGHGVLGAVYAGMVLASLMAVATILGVAVVNYWVEEPLVVREKLHFDFTEFNPHATLVLGGGVARERKRRQHRGEVPIGHTFHVSVELLVPDSDYNRDIGVFQVMAEVISTNAKIIARSSQPSMLHYRSHPIRLMQTFFMGFPLLLGLKQETQTINVHLLKYKEDSLIRTEAIKITLMPRAGTPYLPQLYEAEILMHSRMPWLKELIHNWKWTFYVWTSVHIYLMLLMLILCFFRPLLVFPVLKAPVVVEQREERRVSVVEREEKQGERMPEQREFTETLRKWQQRRRKRKAELLSKSSGFMDDFSLTSTSSYTLTRGDTGPSIEEDVGDSESVCTGS